MIHLVGDIHQPLHNVAQYSKDFPVGEGDRGGNECKINVAMSNVSSDITDLHKLWDSAGGYYYFVCFNRPLIDRIAHFPHSFIIYYYVQRFIFERCILSAWSRWLHAAVRCVVRVAGEGADRELFALVIQRHVHSKVQLHNMVVRGLRFGRQIRLCRQLIDLATVVQVHEEQTINLTCGNYCVFV